MADVKINMAANGPLLVKGPFELIDSEGNSFTVDASKPAITLCRCGQSARQPFCDGSHKSCEFVCDPKAS
ncbi:Iron-binding zinc finger CDGSH type [Pseudobythopirellula maris]|uniref:Iron-binding zinc finger CDGSH type n=1 Tax=Pseudobythopirellula maris TaxID=2527991 RepID=A0A5C5ZL75_9BACT|nr:CDGSH iron-sulfur domain-containing protein [Pseudobythopirellula maris]TWT88192.1 Iron-binding zinc finger CDGSH type [Pseudobythopirellula maris]